MEAMDNINVASRKKSHLETCECCAEMRDRTARMFGIQNHVEVSNGAAAVVFWGEIRTAKTPLKIGACVDGKWQGLTLEQAADFRDALIEAGYKRVG